MTPPPLSINVPGKGRFYRHPVTGVQVPSVTNILSVLNKKALPYWSAKAVAEYADAQWDVLSQLSSAERIPLMKGAPWRESGAKADLGTSVHDAVDAWCTDRPLPEWEPGVAPFMEQFVGFLDDCKPQFIENEFTVWSSLGYAGTADALVVMNDKFVLLDWKTGKGVYPEAALQLTALARADFILREDGTEDDLPPVDQLMVLHLRPRSWSLIPVIEEPNDCDWETFLGLAEAAHWVRDCAGTALGAPRRST